MNRLDPTSAMLLTSPEGFNSKLWGRGMWAFMHYIALNYPISPTKSQVESYKMFFRSLCDILPCNVCRKEFCNLVTNPKSRFFLGRPGLFPYKQNPAAARLRLFMWTSELHNAVNRRLKKPIVSPRTWIVKYLKTRHRHVPRYLVRTPTRPVRTRPGYRSRYVRP